MLGNTLETSSRGPYPSMPCSDRLTLPSTPLPPTAVTVTGTLTLQGGFHTTALVRTGACLTSFTGRDANFSQASRIRGLVPEMVPLWEMLYVYLGDESLAIGCRILEDGLLRPLALASTQMPRGGKPPSTTYCCRWHDASLLPPAQGKRKGGPDTESMSQNISFHH